MRLALAVLGGAALVAASILFVERYQLTTVSGENEAIYRLDRWTGRITECWPGGPNPADWMNRVKSDPHADFECGFLRANQQNQYLVSGLPKA